MRNKFLSFLVVSIVFLSTYVYSEEGTSLNNIVARMTTELNLTAEQIVKIKPIVKENILKRQAFYDEQAGNPITNNKKFKVVARKYKKEMNEQLVKILTPQQMKKLVERQNIRDSLNKDVIDFSEGLTGGVVLSTQGGSFQF